MPPSPKDVVREYTGPACPHCDQKIRFEKLENGPQHCSACRDKFEAVRFDPPALRTASPERAGLGLETEAPCARHELNRAVAACDRCGQFICALCRIESDGRSTCPSCFERLSSEGNLESMITRRTNFSGITVMCLLGSTLLCMAPYFSVPIGIVGITYAVKGLRDLSRRNEEEGRVGLTLMLILVILTTLGGTVFIVMMMSAFFLAFQNMP